ncbi:type II toxin-antitoxin system Phd/YefM family antitoxin [Candidatus Microgenomates bacterium]|nr:type II toxin-antitoxin system Phd/YefM family antitoxin [Candidatus Microgenomates bacterium]
MQLSNILDKKFIGTDDFRRDLTDILKKLSKEGEVIITQHGQPKGVLMGVSAYLEYEELLEKIADSNPKLIKEINEAIVDVKAGNGVLAEKVWKQLGI